MYSVITPREQIWQSDLIRVRSKQSNPIGLIVPMTKTLRSLNMEDFSGSHTASAGCVTATRNQPSLPHKYEIVL
jgi:hypothetical protein